MDKLVSYDPFAPLTDTVILKHPQLREVEDAVPLVGCYEITFE